MSTLPSDTPRLPKWPFLVADAALLGIAVTIALRSPSPYSAAVILAITGCVAFAAILGVLPFLADYAAKQDEALDERQRGLEALTRTVADSAEQISIAANGFHELSELAREQLKQAEALSEKFQVGLEESHREREEALVAENKALQKELKTLRAAETGKLADLGEQFQQAIAELRKLPVAAPAPAATKKTDAAVSKPNPAAETPPVREAPEKKQPAEQPPPPPARTDDESAPTQKDSPATPASSEKPASIESKSEPGKSLPPPDSNPQSGSAAPKPAREKKSASKSEPEPSEDDDATPPAPAASKKPASSPSSDEFDLEEIDAPKAQHKISPDGVTRLIVTAYIGIGNRLFIRGDGPGLSRDKGVPLQFVSIGKWQWETSDASAPVKFKLYKNDEIECLSLGEVTIDARSQAEVTASF